MLTLKKCYNPKSVFSTVVYGLSCTTFGTEVWAPLGPSAALYLSTSFTLRLHTRAKEKLTFWGSRFISCEIQQRAKHVARMGYLRKAHKFLTPKTEVKILVELYRSSEYSITVDLKRCVLVSAG
jgi:hypothetical protein